MSDNILFWREFINMYKQLPELWDVKNIIYRERARKNIAYDNLVQKMQEVDPTATKNKVRQKINILRTNYRRELKKAAKFYHFNDNKKYTSSLWYFHDLDFLRQNENSISADGSYSEDDESKSFFRAPEECQSNLIEQTMPVEKKIKLSSTEKSSPQPFNSTATAPMGRTFDDHLPYSNDEADVISKGWAIQYQKASPVQQLLAKRAIDEILFEACMGRLEENTDRFFYNRDPSTYMQPVVKSYCSMSSDAGED